MASEVFSIECCSVCEQPKVHKNNAGWTECDNKKCPSFAEPKASASYYPFVKKKHLDEALEKIKELESSLKSIQQTVDLQAANPGLWFVAEKVTEDYLQFHLRHLHEVIERALGGGENIET